MTQAKIFINKDENYDDDYGFQDKDRVLNNNFFSVWTWTALELN